MNARFYWSGNTGVSVDRSPQENVTYEFIPSFLVVHRMSCSFYFYDLCDGK